MTRNAKRLAVLGSTGSIGTQTLDVVRTFPEDFSVTGLAARRSLDLLELQVREFRPKFVYCEGSREEKAPILSNGCAERSMEEMVRGPDVDMVVTATVGDVSLRPTFAAMETGKDIALANKETVVMAGEMLAAKAEEHGVSVFPLDSEPNAIWQCLRGEQKAVSRIMITASGGAFRDTPIEELADVTPEQALNHPTWKMGAKITVDSATMMNKAFEVIEAHWLFGVPWDDIHVVIHPQSMIHSMVEFVDGSVKAQISPPDMRLPIQYALFYPERVHNRNIRQFDPVATGSLTFEPWDPERYPCFDIALDIARRGGTWPAALSGADDAAVDMFLARRIGYLEIRTVIQEALSNHHSVEKPSIEEILAAGAWSRRRVVEVVEG